MRALEFAGEVEAGRAAADAAGFGAPTAACTRAADGAEAVAGDAGAALGASLRFPNI
ncbi:MAG: hypothetical protein HY054_06550 [Proteobacteria bacterium]|nr:hypothetical protein [Pseudomonadota bacterium]